MLQTFISIPGPEKSAHSKLDVSGNSALESLTCGGTKMTSLDVSGNTSLTRLSCQGTYSAAGAVAVRKRKLSVK